ncbi:MAG: dksA [Panacagrimonas sp.]|jgi:DnaK suppressor protein|nr:RNA polymerase-binding protein DksA [Panacagrimonas sp.]MCC2658435.1 dksA [Panacagrimonas sp.]
MAKIQPKKKAAPPAKRAVGKTPSKKAPAKPAKAAPSKAKKSATPASKKPAPRKPAPKPAPKAKAKAPVAAKRAPAKPTKAAKVSAPAASSKRAVAVSHRPQSGAVAVQARPSKAAATPAGRPRPERSGDGLLPSGVMLTEDQVRRAPDSAYMNDNQLAFFQERLLQMRSEVLARELDVKERLHQREVFADPADRASAEEEHWLDLRLRERESLLLKKIDDALRRIRDKEYGYCEKTGEAIGIARLLARPTATVCVDIKGQDERAESQYRDR